jgi:hypothetical protein
MEDGINHPHEGEHSENFSGGVFFLTEEQRQDSEFAESLESLAQELESKIQNFIVKNRGADGEKHLTAIGHLYLAREVCFELQETGRADLTEILINLPPKMGAMRGSATLAFSDWDEAAKIRFIQSVQDSLKAGDIQNLIGVRQKTMTVIAERIANPHVGMQARFHKFLKKVGIR